MRDTSSLGQLSFGELDIAEDLKLLDHGFVVCRAHEDGGTLG